MTERIVLSIVAIAMFALAFKGGDKPTIMLTSGLTLGILLTWTGVPEIILFGLIIYMLSALLISIFNLKSNGLSKLERITILLTGGLTFAINLSSIMHWPYAGIMRLMLIIPVSLFLLSLFAGITRKKEAGYVTIMNIDFILRLIR